jgi:hypothetical protein
MHQASTAGAENAVMALKIGRLSMTVPGVALAVLLAAACSSSAPEATLVAQVAPVAGCVKVQTLTYGAAPGAHPAAAGQCEDRGLMAASRG